MKDKQYIIGFDDYSEGYLKRQFVNTDDLGEYWFWIEEDPSIEENMKFYRLEEIDKRIALVKMQQTQRNCLLKEKYDEIKKLKKKIYILSVNVKELEKERADISSTHVYEKGRILNPKDSPLYSGPK